MICVGLGLHFQVSAPRNDPRIMDAASQVPIDVASARTFGRSAVQLLSLQGAL